LYIFLSDRFSDELSGFLYSPTADDRAPATLSLFPRISSPSEVRVRAESHRYPRLPPDGVILITSCDAKQSQTELFPFPLWVNVEVQVQPLTEDVTNE